MIRELNMLQQLRAALHLGSSSSLVMPEHLNRSASVAVTERSDRSLRGCSSSSNITSVMSSQQSIRTMPVV